MKVITITNEKGGVAKSTTAQALAAGLKFLEQRVLAVDLDAQGNLTDTTNAEKSNATVFEVLSKTESIHSAIQCTVMCDVLPSSRQLLTADIAIAQTGKEYRLREALDEVRDEYDYVIIDTPPTSGILAVNALTACDDVIIPAQPDIYSMQGILKVIESVAIVREYCNNNIRIAGILLTRVRTNTNLAKEIAEEIESNAEKLGTKLFKSRIRECIALSEAQVNRMDMFRYDCNSNGSNDYLAFMKEYLGAKNG